MMRLFFSVARTLSIKVWTVQRSPPCHAASPVISPVLSYNKLTTGILCGDVATLQEHAVMPHIHESPLTFTPGGVPHTNHMRRFILYH